ncbi:acetoacetate metabolism regulatory protein AtoC [Desulfocucumis palustris]|uniref:Stage 0 sporulation protein A homolog n=1 Tax=Desulfocucumis palustris TaxID=1898651 RepID=A0A2L2XDU9_9FIRM|nr:LytTR family DNA-binding domain-containing protein [Desulfocucumis palustris]GBF32001.1 acetoacetate metabolism regulatory protein AtoC [Desulfocucumis palustris]
MNVLIAHSEKSIRSVFINVMKKIDSINIVGEASTGFECIQCIDKYKPDVIYLDIAMKDISGLEIGNIVNVNYKNILIVIITYNAKFISEALKINAVDYIFEPITPDRIILSALKARQCLNHNIKRMSIKRGSSIYILDINNICFVGKELKKSVIYTDDDKIDVYESLNNLLYKLPGNKFLRTHQSYIVNVTKVKELTPFSPASYYVRFSGINDTALLLREKYDEFCKMIQKA